MNAKVTDMDWAIARNIKSLRESGGLTQKHVADYLGVAYQSYQKMESGKVSFRASTLDKLAQLYDRRLYALIRGSGAQTDPRIVKASHLLHGMDNDSRDAAIRAILLIKQGKTT